MIVVTGAAGFIGSNLIKKLNEENFKNIVGVDKFEDEIKNENLRDCILHATVDREAFQDWAKLNAEAIEFIFHLGAITDTTETNTQLLKELNTEYSKKIWKLCVEEQIPLIYASSAATYGDGSHGFSTDLTTLKKLKPLNAYAHSKHDFDLWAIAQDKQPFFWRGLKFFNVYGPNEAHKGKMASMVFQMAQQIRETGKVKLFKSYRPDYTDGEQKRDFIHVQEVTNEIYSQMHKRKISGIFNLGTGKARSFNEMANYLFKELDIQPNIEYIEMPQEIRDKYQYFTEAKPSTDNSN
ncbi:MAG: ADP-glyceromanno-heptose 6-epimerase [Marinoscillum sp.]